MILQNCPICDKEIKVYKSQKRKYCSKACLAIGYKEQLKGPNNPNYRHGPKHCSNCNKIISKGSKGLCQSCRGLAIRGKNNPFYGKKHTIETRKKMSENHADCTGVKGAFYGKKHTQEAKVRMSESRKAIWLKASKEYKQKALACLRKGIRKQLDSREETKPERITRNILEALGIEYEQEILLYEKFFVDFLLSDGTIIEVFGDYWHCNPLVFPKPNMHQKKQIKKDKSRIAYLQKCKHKVIILWEKDLKENPNLVQEKLQNMTGD